MSHEQVAIHEGTLEAGFVGHIRTIYYYSNEVERMAEMIIDKVKKLCSDTVTPLNKLCQGSK